MSSEKDDTESVTSHDVSHKCGSCDCPPTAFYSLGCGLLLVGSLLFLIFCSELIPPYAFTNGFKKSTCTVTSAALLDDVCCESTATQSQCEKGYDYPCVNVVVVENGDDTNLTLYDQFKSLAYESKTSKEQQCSFFHCDSSSYKERKKDVKSFLRKHDVGKKVTCYVKNNDALLEVTSDAGFGALLTFSLILLISGAAICLVTYIYMRIHAKEQRDLHNQSIEKLLPDGSSSRSSSASGVGDIRRNVRKEAFTETKGATRSDISIVIQKSAEKDSKK